VATIHLSRRRAKGYYWRETGQDSSPGVRRGTPWAVLAGAPDGAVQVAAIPSFAFMNRSLDSDTALRSLVDSIPEYSIFLLDAERRIVAWGEGAERNLGYTQEEATGLSFASLLPDDAEDWQDALLRQAVGQGHAECEAELVKKDGSRAASRLTVSAVRHDERGAQGFNVVARDVTMLRALEAALSDAEARFTGIISVSSDAIVSVDESQRIIFFNQGAEQVFGYKAAEVLHQPLDLLIPERFRPDHAAQLLSFGQSPIAARRMGERGQIAGLRKGGEIFPADASISKYLIGGQRIYTAVLRDVTERQRAEEALAKQAEELARSNADLEQFAYVASHDLQEPLRMVASYTQLLARRYQNQLDEDAAEFIGYAVDGVRRMQSLINDLLAYSRVGTRGGVFTPTDVNAVLARVLVSLGPSIEEQDAVVMSDELPVVDADAGHLEQLLQNLIGNAIKFRLPDVPPHVHVSAARSEDEWVFSVRDNGIGIDPEFVDRIFVIFQRLHNRTEYPGTGIGLAICKKIVERHGGRIWLESAAGQGSTFFFSIPDHR
jgi:PAS domain S-box-containing protein